jgi:phage gp36-like protein
MAYCTEAQVQAEFKELKLSGTSSVTSAQIVEFIEEADAEINAIIGLKYVTPVSTGDALVLCRRMSRAIVFERISQKLAIKIGDPKLSQDSSRLTKNDALALARQIADGTVKFGGATLQSSADGVSSFTSSNNVERVFKKDTKQW